MPLAQLEPIVAAASDAPPPPPPAATDFAEPLPLAVHLGSLRPMWLTATDGSELLVLVRTARLENKKTIYQGVALDWAKLQAALKDEVRDLFPEAALFPAKDPNGPRDQTMTALPVRLDLGPLPATTAAGWTPLRIGLLLSWIAAALAFVAIGLTGWSLVDLAERRIRFVSAVTHELRTPLTSLRLYLDLLLSGMVQDEEKRREYLSTLNVESDRLHRLIDNVLDYARLERRRKGRTLQAANAADLLDMLRRTWTDRVAADAKELVVVSTLPAEQEFLTDASLVQQIVGNLIDNARKYTRDAADPHIWVKARMEGTNRLIIEVEDRGAGVPPREQKLIFRPFRRGETADTTAGGAGLGLALSKEWAEILGGRLTYRAVEPGPGSCFRLELPVK
jgi:signal transduction histidine kinase